jgi:hypothetical protein
VAKTSPARPDRQETGQRSDERSQTPCQGAASLCQLSRAGPSVPPRDREGAPYRQIRKGADLRGGLCHHKHDQLDGSRRGMRGFGAAPRSNVDWAAADRTREDGHCRRFWQPEACAHRHAMASVCESTPRLLRMPVTCALKVRFEKWKRGLSPRWWRNGSIEPGLPLPVLTVAQPCRSSTRATEQSPSRLSG